LISSECAIISSFPHTYLLWLTLARPEELSTPIKGPSWAAPDTFLAFPGVKIVSGQS
jgi:hypothetical protein